MIRTRGPRVVLLGMLSNMPVAGVAWQTLHYLVGLQRLGCDVTYLEAHRLYPSMFGSSEGAASYIDRILRPYGFGDRWAYEARHDVQQCFGLSEGELRRRLESADLVINLHGGTMPKPEHYANGHLIFLETDPVALQIELHDGLQSAVDFLSPHAAFFTFGENYGQADCRLPVSDCFPFKPTRQPVVMEWWQSDSPAGAAFTTIGNWNQDHRHRAVYFEGTAYGWSKHAEFMKLLDLPQRVSQPFELALATCGDEDRQMLEEHGWHVRDALGLSQNLCTYRDYICASRGEFTVAKDQNIQFRSGWFSDRSATYLAAGRPVINQETGFSNVLPTGEGLFAFTTMDEVIDAIDEINADYPRHSRAAQAIAHEYFDSDVVLGRLLTDVGW